MKINAGSPSFLLILPIALSFGCGNKGGGGPECGNDEIETGEICDGIDLGDPARTCVDEGFTSGTLACNATCDGWDPDDCEGGCGNDVAEGLEICDGADIGSPDRTCADEGFDGGTIACDDTCLHFDTSGCYRCGDATIGGDEVCDGTNLGLPPRTCTDEGFEGGTIACLDDCTGFDTSGCVDCGDDVRTGTELCDGTDLGDPARTCADEGYAGGTLECNDTCDGFVIAGCTGGCGNLVTEFPEECDGDVPGGTDCTARGLEGGTVTCTAACTLDTSACTYEWCGDGTADAGEDCDDTDLGTPAATCTGEGFTGGTIACSEGCTLDLSECTGGCGNGVAEGTEACDGADLGGRTCADEGFATGALGCTTDCTDFVTTGCLDDPVCTADGGYLGEIAIGDDAWFDVDTSGADDSVTLSCQDGTLTTTNDMVFEVVVLERGRLVVTALPPWNGLFVVGVFNDSPSAGSCFTSEVACSNEKNIDLGTVEPGRYYVAVSSESESVDVTWEGYVALFATDGEICGQGGWWNDNDLDGFYRCDDPECADSWMCSGETACSDGMDDDRDTYVDCEDLDCFGSTDCTGSACVPDQDLGTLGHGTWTGIIDVSAASNDLALPCSASDGPDTVIEYALPEDSTVDFTVEQPAGTAHAVAWAMQAGPGSGCAQALRHCQDISLASTDPVYQGTMELPAGTYYLIIEGPASGAGSVDVTIAVTLYAENECSDGVDDDGDGAIDCEDLDCSGTTPCAGSACAATADLGTLVMGAIETFTADTSTATNLVDLDCATANGNDVVESFTLAEPAKVIFSVDQATGSRNEVGIAMQAGAGTACDASEIYCVDLSTATGSPDLVHVMEDPLPTGTYYFIVGATYGLGQTTVQLGAFDWIETECANDVDDDFNLHKDCNDFACAADPACAGSAKGIFEAFGRYDSGDDFDLAGALITFTPVPGTPDQYVTHVADGVTAFPVTPGTGDLSSEVTLGFWQTREIVFTVLATGFDFYGVHTDTIVVGSSGIVTVGAGSGIREGWDVVAGNYVRHMFSHPSIAPLWASLDPSAGGIVTYDEFADRAAVTFDGAAYSAHPGIASFQVVLWADGHVTMAWLDTMEPPPVQSYVGISAGTGVGDIPAEADLRP